MYWVRGSETVIRCFSPCDNALEVEEPRRRSPQSFRNLLVELSSPNRAPTQRGVGLRFALDADESNNHIIGVYPERGDTRIDASRLDAENANIKTDEGNQTITPESLSVLKSILSLKPIYKGGDIFFAFNPATLQSLRRLLKVRETERSREIRLSLIHI